VRFRTHGEPVTRAADGRTGTVKDIEGVQVNVAWDDDPPAREWVHLDELAD
jgi:hypothetical protein